ncbi:MAG: PIN domain-containing protein [Rubrivivax sp.]|nr:PIN domain-containing protein [Rubrivivax sp.]
MKTPTPAASGALPVAVLDTNAVLDAWLFEAPAARALRLVIESSRLRWEATEPMLNELASVLARPIGHRWEGRREAVRAIDWQRWARLVPIPPPCAAGWRCADPDDQKFLDLALHARADWLISRDWALLRLRRRASAVGVCIVGPEGWLAPPERDADLPNLIDAAPPTGLVAS